MNHKLTRGLALIFALLVSAHAVRAQSPRLQNAKSRTPGTARMTPRLLLFGAIPISTRSEEARKLTELAIDKYENVMVDDAIVQAEHATEKDPDFALGYAVLSFVSRRGSDKTALVRAKALLPRATPDEQLMARWMVSIQDRNLVPAISSMNDLLKRYPKNKHILYLVSAWLYSQEDSERAQKMMEDLQRLDPTFPPVLNMLGYSYIESGRPDPAKAVAAMKRYVEVDPSSPNPEDSLGEVLRYTGDDAGSLEHYSAALQIDPTFFTSQLGLGDTLTLMGKYDDARLEYDKAIRISENNRDLLHASFQEALVNFWEGRPEEGQKALAALGGEALRKKESSAHFEIAFGAAMLAGDDTSELNQLQTLEENLQLTLDGMTGAERGRDVAKVLCEEARIASRHAVPETTERAIAKLAVFAAQSGDIIVENNYETARGYASLSLGDLASASDEFSANRRSPLAMQQLALIRQKSGDIMGAREAFTELKYQRAPSVEWYLATSGRNVPD
jgi:tetratricopeptide (TPR) repeat protein